MQTQAAELTYCTAYPPISWFLWGAGAMLIALIISAFISSIIMYFARQHYKRKRGLQGYYRLPGFKKD